MHASYLSIIVIASLAMSAPARAQGVAVVPADTVPKTPPADTVGIEPAALDTGAIAIDDATETPTLVPVKVTAGPRRRGYAARETSTATRTLTKLRDVPQSVTVITRELIAEQSMQSLADVARYIPGITMGQGEGNRDQPTIRGNSTTADFFIDGVRDDAQYFRDLYNVERVEAMKGSNAMIFGRGGGGGVVNRVMKEADWTPLRELVVQGGSHGNRRATVDVGQGVTERVAGRVNAVYENSGSFRDGVTIDRQGIHPTAAFLSASGGTRLHVGYENFLDERVADRGIASFGGRPLSTDPSTFFGNPALSYSRARVHSGAATFTRLFNPRFAVRNNTRLTSYDKVYQNVFPGSVSADGQTVSISGYNNAHDRRNLISQTDLTYVARAGKVAHTLLLGAELGRQVTDNFRQTGYFNNSATSISVPVSSPTDFTPVTFRQSASDADNQVRNGIEAIYAQDQISFSDQLQLVAGMRYEKFAIRVHNRRSDSRLARTDGMLSPRLGLIVKPVVPVSLYASYSVSYLPSAGDQFASLTDVTRALEPERFRNLEIGAKWDVADRLALTSAFYQLDRSNTTAPSPVEPGVIVQTGTQRSTGFELGASGSVTPAWEIAGGLARQKARITSTTTSAPAGATVPLVPAVTLSLWNKYQLAARLGAGLGVVHQAPMYTSISNSVTLPAFTRLDGALFLRLGDYMRAQMNVENLLNVSYFPLAHNDNNITPGSPRAVRLSITTGF